MSRFVELSPMDVGVIIVSLEDASAEFHSLASALPPGGDRDQVAASARRCDGLLRRLKALRASRGGAAH